MNTITKTVYLVAYHWDWQKPGELSYGITDNKPKVGGCILDCWPHEVTLPAPKDFNVYAAQLAAIEAEKRQAFDAYRSTVASINERLGKLQALTNEVQV